MQGNIEEKILEINTDGGSRGNPGPAAYAFVVKKNGKIIFEHSRYIGNSTNNVAEYSGLVGSLEWLKENVNKFNGYKVKFYLDSELVVKQINGLYKIKNENLKKFLDSAKKLTTEINLNMEFISVRRDKNERADFLLNETLDSR